MDAKTWIKLAFCLAILTLIANECSAEVSNNFEKCKQFFYAGKPPQYAGSQTTTVKQICQRYKNRYHYATSYDTKRRIPHYSAYGLESFDVVGGRDDYWLNEPQLQQSTYGPNMADDSATNRQYQAVDNDYSGSGYDRGHLSAKLFNSESQDSITASNSLTNIAPQVPIFNQGIWRELEQAIFDVSRNNCNFQGAKRYFITGVLPSKDQINGQNTINGRVNIPTHYWTAICCDSSEATHRSLGWSAGFIGENKANPDLWYEPVSKMNKIIGYNTLFAEKDKIKHCNFNPDNTERITNYIFNRAAFINLRQQKANERATEKQTKRKFTTIAPPKVIFEGSYT